MSTKKIVVKFGGSNLRTPGDISRIASLIQLYNRPLVVVVSAFYGITNALIQAVGTARDSSRDGSAIEATTFTTQLRQLKDRILLENIPDPEARSRIGKEVHERLDQLERYLLGIHYIGDVPESLNDMVLSYGERLSSLVLAGALQSRGIDCVERSPEDLGLYSDGEFGNATCDFARSQDSVQRGLADDRIYVVPGFYGLGPDGKPTLFGRGGSDYSAASIARCIGAESLDMWKDVDGFLSADPSSVDTPQVIGHLNYLEAAELSYFGAKILHPRTVEPLLDQSIPVRILDIRRSPQTLIPGTVVDGSRSVRQGIVKAVSATEDIGIVKIHGPGVGFKSGILAKATSALDMRGINIKSVLTAQTSICLLLARADLDRAATILSEHHMAGVVNVSVVDDLAMIAVVGDGVLDASGYGHGIAAKALVAAHSAGIRVAMAGAGASEVAVYLLVSRADRSHAVKVLHGAFFS